MCSNNTTTLNSDDSTTSDTSQDKFTLHNHDDLAFAGNFLYVTEQINILLVGKSQSGKSAILKALTDPRFRAFKSGFSGTRESKCFRMVLYTKAADKVYQVNIIDTPGLKEVTENIADQREDAVLLDLVKDCIKASVTTLNCICFVSEASRTHQNDIDVFFQLMEFLREEFSENSMLILTHADSFTEKRLDEFKSVIERHEKTQPTYQFCKLGVLYQGIVDFDELETYKTEDLRNQVMQEKLDKLAPLRRRLVECFISTIGKQKDIGELHRIKNGAAQKKENIVTESKLQMEQQHKQIQELQEELEEQRRSQIELKTQLEQKEGELEDQQKIQTGLKTQLEQKEEDLAVQQKIQTELKTQLEQKQGELVRQRQKQTELEAEVQQLRAGTPAQQ